MKKLLSILLILFLTTSSMWGETTLTLEATASPTNGGTLKATGGYVKCTYLIWNFYKWESKDYTSANGVLTAYGKNEQDGLASYAASDMDVKIENITATPNTKFYFSKWDEVDASGEPIKTGISNPFSLTHKKADGNKTVYYRATFKPLVEVPAQVKMVVYNDGTEDALVQLPSVHNRTSLTIALSGKNASEFLLAKKDAVTSDVSLSYSSSDGIGDKKDVALSFQLLYVGDGSYSSDEALAVQNTSITITDNEKNVWTIPIVMTEPETYTFRGVDNGTYSVDFVASDKKSISNIAKGNETKVQLRSADYEIKLTATPATGYELFGWLKITKDANGNEKAPEYFSYVSPDTKNLEESAIIYPVFIPTTQATFFIKEDTKKTPYYDLQEALNVAKNTNGYSIVVLAKKEATLAPRMSGKDIIAYDIPSGVTLLIPGDDAFTCSKQSLGTQDVALTESQALPICISKLNVQEGTKFDVKGNIYLYAKIRHGDIAGQPITYGQMHLGKNVQIALQDGSNLYAYGYITGNYTVNDYEFSEDAPQVIAYDGSVVHELFQFTDWRGGTASWNMNGNNQKVFPIRQYYIQSIEVPLTIKQGASEKFLTAVEASSEISVTNANLIGPGNNGSLFCAIQNTDVLKFYDVKNDRIKLIARGVADGAKATFGSITLNFKMVMSVTVTSSKYVLPISHHYDILMDNVSFETGCDMELLAGSTITIDEDASLLIKNGNRIFIYDEDENKKSDTEGYCGSGNAQFSPINYTPSNPNVSTIRTSVGDAKVVVNGMLTVENGAVLCTTQGGAIITSDGGGIYSENNTQAYNNDKLKLYQAIQNNTDISYNQIATTAAKLCNSDGSYVETSKVYPGTYTYYITNESTKAGVWSLPPATITADSWTGTSVKATMPTTPVEMTIKCKVSNVSSDSYAKAFDATLSNTTDFAFADEKFRFDAPTNTLSIHVIYTPRDNTETDAASSLTLVNTTIPAAEYTYTTTLTATEEYVPNFTLDKEYIQLPSVQLGQTATVNNAFTITPAGNNVAGMQDSRLKWTCSLSDSDFGYTQGSLNSGVITDNTITFTSSTEGTKYATLTITATYTPTTGTAETYPQTINLTGTTQTVNTLQFSMDDQIWVTDKNLPVQFADQNNTSDITVTLTNEDNSTPAAELNASGGTYTINALNAGTFTLTATQSAFGNYAGTVITKTITVAKRTPEPVWNWGVVYGNQSYTLPFNPNSVEDGYWTLIKRQDEKNLLDYDKDSKTLRVHNIQSQSIASFLFNQEETHDYTQLLDKDFSVTINKDPRILPIEAIGSKAEYDIIEYLHSDNVTYESGLINIPAGGYLVLEFVGIPGNISFETEGDLSGIQLFESVDASEESWSLLEKVAETSSWKFKNYSPSKYVKLSNSSDDNITIRNTQISLYDAGDNNVYYARVSAQAYPENIGVVSVQGGYISGTSNTEESKIFSPDYEDLVYTSISDGYYHLLVGAEDLDMIFHLYAQSIVNGYYFSNWSVVGSSPIQDELAWAGANINYQLPIIISHVSDMYMGYPFSIYQEVFKTLNPDIYALAKPESGEPSIEALKVMNAGTLALIPATHMGTWQANFALAEVLSVEDVSWESNSPNADDAAKTNVVFNVLGDDVNDFEASISGNGFSFAENDITLSTTYKTYTVNVSYIPQDIHDTHTGTLTLSRVAIEGVSETSSETATLTVTEDLTPSFTLADGAFGEGTLGQESIIEVVPADKNKVAQVTDPNKMKWEATLNEGAPFEILSVADDGTCQVRYFRTTSGNQSATLTLTATYTDSKGTPIHYDATCNLSGSATADKAENTLAFMQDIVMYVDDEPLSPFSSIDANNTAPITITLPADCGALVVENGMIRPSGTFATGTFTITATQAENDYFQASGDLTTTVTVKKHTPEVKWNWTQLYFGQTYDTPITTNSDGAVTIAATNTYNILQYNDATKIVVIQSLTEGEYDVTFSVNIAESDLYESYQQTHTSVVYKDPRHLRVDVNTAVVYQAVTIADRTGENVSFSNGGIRFADVAGSESTSRQWTMYFIGVPDQLVFTPTGNNAWQIQESANGSNWGPPTFASAKIPAGEQFTMSLRPNTQYLRITYATNAETPSDGALNGLFVTPLVGVKANVDGLYMPIAADPANNPTTKQVILQYNSQEDLSISTSDPQFVVDVVTLPKVDVDTYAEQTILVTSKATTAKEGRIYVKNTAGDILLELPIQSFVFPQSLPIQLATDEPQRFYYVTTATEYAKWNMNEHIITMQNVPSNTDRSLTFAFDGAPTLIRFNHTAADKGTWKLLESADNAYWYEASAELRQDQGTEIEQGLQALTRYVKVKYTSPYSEAVEMSNLIIVGDASVTTDVNVLEFTEEAPTQKLTVSAINLTDFVVKVDNDNFTVAEIDKSALTGTGIVEVPVEITWSATKAVEYATLSIVNPADEETILATVELVGKKSVIISPTNVGICTGLSKDVSEIKGDFEGTKYRPVDLTNAFDAATSTKALFDYLFIYGETSTMDGTSVVTTPTSQRGSNAKTPCYIYQREGDTYKLYKVVDNVNDSEKAIASYIPVPVSKIPLRVYITGFAPYASTGYTKEDEGVWQFRGEAGSRLDVYLEDCYIYSRYKTIDGHSFIDRENGESFAEQYARGSGGVLVFECSSVNNAKNPFQVTIHTKDRNMLKSHYGCFLSSIVGRAYQVSSPVQVHLISVNTTATTHLSFDDIWPTAITRTEDEGVVTAETLTTKRTNGFLSLQKQVNNAPSIDLGSPNTVVNFNGGQVELQNAQNVSDNYKTTLAISYRGGKFAGYFLAHGVGSDEVSGTVNFNDGTTTVIPMKVDAQYRQYYLMDVDENGNELETTSTLRCPQNTYVYGGSHCMMRACNEPTSKGGAPLSHAGEDAVRLGLYKYPYASYTTGEGDDVVTHAGGWTLIEGGNGRVEIPADYIPNIKIGDQVTRQYGVASVTPNDNGTTDILEDDYLNFWVPAGYDDSVTPEVDMKISYWKAAMTQISAEYASYGGTIGGDVTIGNDTDTKTELVYNFLYCMIDQSIHDIITAKENINGNLVHTYEAKVKHPTGNGYLNVRPSSVGDSKVHYVTNRKSFEIQNRIYYITPIESADMWMTFTAPFDVENVYVVETFNEVELANKGTKEAIKRVQATHNADFAAFFGVALALGAEKSFDDIYLDYIGWAKMQDVGKYDGAYNLRGKHELEFYNGTNWSTADYYLYENQEKWSIDPSTGNFITQWTLPNVEDAILMNQGMTYSMLFPYCTGCWEYDDDNQLVERTMWDYWSGKFIIFESTLGTTDDPHVILGSEALKSELENISPASNTAELTGNYSFGEMSISNNDYLYMYYSKLPLKEDFRKVKNGKIEPAATFMLANGDVSPTSNLQISAITRTGEIIYETSGNGNNPSTGGNIPTVGGGNDLFITETAGGINVAVAAPQQVRVISSTGAVLYSGMVQTSVDVAIPTTGVYVVAGENEVQKILY